MDEPILTGEDGAGSIFTIRGPYAPADGRGRFYEVHRRSHFGRGYVGRGRTITSAKRVAGRRAKEAT